MVDKNVIVPIGNTHEVKALSTDTPIMKPKSTPDILTLLKKSAWLFGVTKGTDWYVIWELSKGLITIEEGAFSSCKKLKSITIPEGVREIKREAFAYCPALERVSFPSTFLSIGEKAFYNSKSLKDVDIPPSVEYIGDDAFGYSKIIIKR